MQPLFQALYNADADVVLGGHAHDYERFAPQNPSGQLDNARGIRQFVVGTGGAFFTSVEHAEAQQPGPPEQHLRRAEADAAPDQLRLAVRLGEQQAVHRLGHRAVPRLAAAAADGHDEADCARQPRRDRELGPGRAELERVHRQRGRHRLQGLPGRDGDREPRHRDLLHGHDRRRQHHLQLHGARDGRGREPVRPQQHRYGHDARRRRASRFPPRPTPGWRNPPRRPTTRRPICAPTAAPTRPPTASCASR